MENKKRLLAAIMFTDIAGYTAMMQENEQHGTQVRARHRAVFQQAHQDHNGEVLQYYGDGTLSIFQSAVEAVECAIHMQQQFNTGEVVPVRIGIHLGDIVFSDQDVYGDGVNLASRVESLGIPGSILISDKIQYAVKNQGNIQSKSLGHFEFKNITDPVEVFAIANRGVRVPNSSELTGKLKDRKKSVAVLPFVNMSNDPDNEYFSDGITEEILNALVRVEGLKVTARTSSFAFKGQNLDVREIGRQLGVAYLLEGSVRKAGNRVRITAQLVSSADGFHFFSETYDRTLEDIFAVQDEIASTITHRLREHLGESEQQEKLVNVPTNNLEAYEVYLKGLFYYNQWEDGAMAKAIPYFEKAIDMDSGFALPHSRLALCYVLSAMGGIVDWDTARQKGMYHIGEIRKMGVETPEAYFALAVFEIFYQWNWPAALEAIDRGLTLFPNYASLHHALSTMHYIAGNEERMIDAHKVGYELDPMSIEMMFFMGIAYLWNGQLDEALVFLNKVLNIVPHHRPAQEYKGWIFAFQGNYEKAIPIFEQLEPENGYRLHRATCLGWVYYKMNKREKAKEYLQQLLELVDHSPKINMDLATLYAGMEDHDNAFIFLEKTVRNRIGDSMMIRTDIFYKPLRKDPRFKDLEKLVGEVPEIREIG